MYLCIEVETHPHNKNMIRTLNKEERVNLIRVLSSLCLAISMYLTLLHYKGGSSLCDVSDLFSCSHVNSSAYSVLLGVPVALFGVIWSGVMCFGSWKVLQNDKPIYYLTAILLWSFLGVLFIFYMVAAEIILQTICLFCTVIHILTVIIFYHALKLFKDMKATPPVSSFVHTMRNVLIGVFVVCIMPVFVINSLRQPDPVIMGDLASCITVKNIKMFGSDSCGHCQHQKALFGEESFSKINYIDCFNTEEGKAECDKNTVGGFPTWIKFDEAGEEMERVAGVQTLTNLEAFSGCKISTPPPERGRNGKTKL